MSNYMKLKLIPKVDDTFGYWTVIVPGTRYCQCRCLYGKEKTIYTRNLIGGGSTRCRSCAAKTQGNRLWDDKQPIKLRKIAKAAIIRCTVSSNQAYRNYGGRGIKVCDDWLKDPRLFVAYLESLSGWNNEDLVLDRINNDGHYEPGNLRFATRSESSSNQRPRREGCHRRFFGRQYYGRKTK